MNTPPSHEPKKPLVYVALAALLLLVCGGVGVGGFIWMALRNKSKSNPPVTKRGTPPGTPPGKNQRFELDYPEKAEKEAGIRGERAPRDIVSSESRTQPPLAANDPFAGGKFPADYNPNGLFRKLEKDGVRSFSFQPNGTFLLEGTIELKTPNKRDNAGNAESDGTFRIEGTKLSLKFNNEETKELNIRPFDVFRDRTQSLLIDGEIFYRVDNK